MTLFKFPLNTVSVNKVEVTRASNRITDVLFFAGAAFKYGIGKFKLSGGNLVNFEGLIFP